jgi:hypothetical protein
MDRKSIGRLKKSLEARHHELRLGLAKTQREAQTPQHDYGKDEGDRAKAPLAAAGETRVGSVGPGLGQRLAPYFG